MRRRAVLVPGDGIGPEVTDAARRVVDATGADLEWDVCPAGAGAAEAIRSTRVALKGPVTTVPGRRSFNLALRRELDLFLQVRRCRGRGMDVLVARETTEDLYAGIEYGPGDELVSRLRERGAPVAADAAVTIKPVSAGAVRRAASALRSYALSSGRERVTIVHKATAMPATDGLFLRTARETFEGLGGVEVDDMLVDLAAAAMVKDSARFDVVFTGNLYGDILADLLGALAGSVGLVAGVNLGDEVAVFEPAHGSAPRHAGHGRVNPTAAIRCGAMLLRHVGEGAAADRVERAVDDVLAEGKRCTYDVAPPGVAPVSTAAMADAVIALL